MKHAYKKLLLAAMAIASTSSALYASNLNEDTSKSTAEYSVTESSVTKKKEPANNNYINKYLGGETNVMVIGGAPDEEIVKVTATEYYRRSLRKGPWQVGMPKFIITDKSNKASFAIGGFVNFRTAFDFDNVIPNLDFVTSSIPMNTVSYDRSRVLMDASTSRLYFKSIIDGGSVGPIEAYIETDFRGVNNALRLREAYVKVGSFTFGQAVSTFTDLAASPNTIDFEGPNAYTYNRNLLIRYCGEYSDNWSFAIAAEFPEVSATYGSSTKSVYQRVPDIPLYVQYSWNKKASHLRLSGIIRTMDYYNAIDDSREFDMGYGISLSSYIKASDFVSFCGQVLTGRGISNYIQDVNGLGLDMIPDPKKPGILRVTPSFSWFLGTEFNFTPKLSMNLAYSQVHIWNRDTYFNDNQYKLSQYIVGNMFYTFSPSIQLGVEYLYGTRHNQDQSFGKANRVQAMVQITF